MRIFGGETVEKMMDRLGIDENIPIENPLVSRSIEQAQKRVEGYNFDTRKHLVEYDDVMNKQREVVYLLRRKILEWNGPAQEWFVEKLESTFVSTISTRRVEEGEHPTGVIPTAIGITPKVAYEEAQKRFGAPWETFVKQMSLQVIDTLWTEHLDNMEDLREGIGLRGYGGIEPLVEYKREAHVLFGRLIAEIYGSLADRILQAVGEQSIVSEAQKESTRVQNLVYRHDSPVQVSVGGESAPVQVSTVHGSSQKVGRNDPCPCGSGKKFKRCHGK